MLEPSFLSEREQVIGRLERGMYVTKFFAKKKPEKKLLAVMKADRQIFFSFLETVCWPEVETCGAAFRCSGKKGRKNAID